MTMTEPWKNRLFGTVAIALIVGVPLLGCGMVYYTKNDSWFILLLPLFVFMEGAFVLIPLLWFITSILVECCR